MNVSMFPHGAPLKGYFPNYVIGVFTGKHNKKTTYAQELDHITNIYTYIMLIKLMSLIMYFNRFWQANPLNAYSSDSKDLNRVWSLAQNLPV